MEDKQRLTLFSLAGQHKGKLSLSALLAVLSAGLSLVPFYIIYLIAVELLEPPVEQALVWQLVWYFVAAVIGRFLLLFVAMAVSHIAAFNTLYDLRIKLAEELGRLPLGFFNRRTTGGIKKALSEDVERIELFLAHHIPDLAAGIALPLMTLILFFVLDWRMAIAALLPLPIAFIMLFLAYRDSETMMKTWQDSLEEMNGTIVEYVRGMPVVKIFNQTVQSFTRFQGSVYGYRDIVVKHTHKMAPPWGAFVAIVASPLLFILPTGVWLYLRGSLELSMLLLFSILGAGYLNTLPKVISFSNWANLINDGVKRIDEILRQPPIQMPETPRLPQRYDIEFRDVGFAYDEKQVLKNINLKVAEGSVTALVGPSGAGKTTLACLLPRFWDIEEGEILIGGVNIKEMSPEMLMDKVSFVFQDIFMFTDSVFENVRMGKEGGTEEEIIAAAKLAQAHEFIEKLPKGYQTVIGEGGETHLSGGEKQRIAIARAILKDAPIVILDEATAFADPENEAKIQDAFSRLLQEKTVIVIAHRLSSITDADQIVVIDEGQIVEQGEHAELLAQTTLYKRMWQAHTAAQDWRFHLGAA
ncbi:MAG: ABC transporter ATP-binding protein [Chloroflexi bacterium]|nr:ABC transporter ATP-binding protein [Chloroflexota bacterium]